MVNDTAQLYTIEGIAAGLLMLLTAFIVVNSTQVYTPGDTHISDMQLEVLGSDALSMMNTAPNATFVKSPLQTIVETNDKESFTTIFGNFVNNRTGTKPDSVHFTASVVYDNPNVPGQYSRVPLGESRNITGGEHAVRISQWVIADTKFPDQHAGKHAELVEVLLWRD
jgi:hypothetical protein